MTELLTHSRQDCFKVCRMKHHLAYNLRIRPTTEARALRMGSAFHDGVEGLANGEPIEVALERVDRRYAVVPERVPVDEWNYEHETVRIIVNAYAWRWKDSQVEYLAAEHAFKIKLINPATGKPSRLWMNAGKIDGIVRLSDGRIAVIEHKLYGEEIGPDSPLWKRMRMDHQVSLYLMAARSLGYEADTIIFDVARKPTIKPTKVPLLDALGAKIVLNQSGTRVVTAKKEWRQTGDKDLGYTLQERPMTPEEWGQKLNNDIAERPEHYFQRQEIPRMDGDLDEYRQELWDIQLTIRDAQKNNRHYRTVNKETCAWCCYFSMCSNRGFNPEAELPEGFVRVEDVHPELELDNGSNCATETITPTAAACEVAAES